MFPEIDENMITEEPQDAARNGTSFLFDFSKGDFVTVDGKVVKADGLDAVKIWIEKILRTERYKFKIYESGEYGISLLDLTTANYPLDFIKTEVEREIREALEKNPDIQGVHSFSFERIKRGSLCTFTVSTKYGETGGEITV